MDSLLTQNLRRIGECMGIRMINYIRTSNGDPHLALRIFLQFFYWAECQARIQKSVHRFHLITIITVKTGIGAKIRDHSATIEDLAAHALETKVCPDPGSGDEEELQEILNQIMFGKK